MARPTSIWELPHSVYKDNIEDEIGSYINDEGWIEDELALCFGFADTTNPDQGFIYWARRHWYLVDKRGESVLFRPNPLQWRYLLERGNENVELKARKMGQSTVIDTLYYWRARRREHQHMFIVAHTNDASMELWSPQEKKINRRELEWKDNYSKLRVMTAGGRGIGRASDGDGIHLSEAAHYADLSATLAAMGEAKREGAWVDIESTPNGYDDFREECKKAESGDGNRVFHFNAWFMDPTYTIVNGGDNLELTDEEERLCALHDLTKDQIAWRRVKQKDLGPLFQQEHPEDPDTCFLLGGTPLFDNLILREIDKELMDVNRLPAAELEDAPFSGGDLIVWAKPKPGHQYVIGADISEGIPGLAYSVACVVDITGGGYEQVAEWRGHLNPFTFGITILKPLGVWYNRALIAPERNNHGHATIAGLKEGEAYPRIYKHRSNMGSRWSTKGRSAAKFGCPNSSETRPQMLAHLRRRLHDRSFKVKSRRLLKECMSMQAEEAHYDADRPTTEFRDCIFAAAIALFVGKKSLPLVV
jgi:hypothetical protein